MFIVPKLRPDVQHTAARCSVKKGQKVWTNAGHKRDLGTPLGHPSTGLTVWEGVVERKGKNSKGQDLIDVKFPDKTMYFAPYDVVVVELETLFVMPISFIPESEAENLSPTTPKRPRNSEGSSGTPSMPQKKNKGGPTKTKSCGKDEAADGAASASEREYTTPDGSNSSEHQENKHQNGDKKMRKTKSSKHPGKQLCAQQVATCTTGAQHRTLKERPILSGYQWQF